MNACSHGEPGVDSLSLGSEEMKSDEIRYRLAQSELTVPGKPGTRTFTEVQTDSHKQPHREDSISHSSSADINQQQ